MNDEMLTNEKAVTDANPPRLAVKINKITDFICEPCALCGKAFLPEGELGLFLDGTENLVCEECGEKCEPLLVALQELYRFETDLTNPEQPEAGTICKVCNTPGCIEARGPNFHKGDQFGSLKCDYTGTPPFATAEWANHPDAMCLWCAGTGHPYGDESYGICECPGLDKERVVINHVVNYLPPRT